MGRSSKYFKKHKKVFGGVRKQERPKPTYTECSDATSHELGLVTVGLNQRAKAFLK